MAGYKPSIKTHLLETNVVGVFTETLTAQVDAVFSNKTVLVCTRPAKTQRRTMINTGRSDSLLYRVYMVAHR